METSNISSLEQIRASKEAKLLKEHIAALPDEIEAHLSCYLSTNVFGIRNEQVAQKIALHLCRFQQLSFLLYNGAFVTYKMPKRVLHWLERRI